MSDEKYQQAIAMLNKFKEGEKQKVSVTTQLPSEEYVFVPAAVNTEMKIMMGIGCHIAFIGARGCGKTTAATQIIKGCESASIPNVYFPDFRVISKADDVNAKMNEQKSLVIVNGQYVMDFGRDFLQKMSHIFVSGQCNQNGNAWPPEMRKALAAGFASVDGNLEVGMFLWCDHSTRQIRLVSFPKP